MRADRLLKMMLLLQTRGKHTAKELAGVLEVSKRTIYRDVNALSFSGIPIYTEKGPGGGIQLIEDYRTSLTGLSEEEVRALFMLNVPAAMDSLGITGEIQRAMLKLSAALPKYLKEAQVGVQQRIFLDLEPPDAGDDRTPSYLGSLYRAVWEDRMIRIVVRYGFGYTAERDVEAYGLVSMGEFWYLVCRVEGHYKIISLHQLDSLEVLDRGFERQIDFDLASFWRKWRGQQGRQLGGYLVTVWIAPDTLELLRQTMTLKAEMVDMDKEQELRLATLRFENFPHARRTILGLGGAVQVVEPEAMRRAVIDYARQTLKKYEG
jgi:predicted DNA-binding transcriptional regulator YafY